MNCVNFWRIINDMNRFSIDFLVYSGKNAIILATLASQTYDEQRQKNYRQPLWQMLNLSTFLSQFSGEDDQFWSQKGQKTNIIFFY
jgi:hypothetical protein